MFSLILLEASGLAVVRTCPVSLQAWDSWSRVSQLIYRSVSMGIKDYSFKPLNISFLV